MSDRVWFRAHFERYPATVKGAFVLRAADGVPHQVVFRGSRCAELSGGADRELGLEDVVVDVAPNLDLFVPFEFPSTELGSGWYQLACEILVDGTPESVRPGSRFAMPWPRAATRRGRVAVDTAVDTGSGKVLLGQLECGADTVRLGYESPERVSLKLSADGRRLTELEHEHDPETGHGRVTAYPAMRDEERLGIELRGSGEQLLIALP